MSKFSLVNKGLMKLNLNVNGYIYIGQINVVCYVGRVEIQIEI